MLKRKIDQETFDALPDAMKPVYAKKGDEYVLQLDNSSDDDAAELKRAKDREVQARKDAEKLARELQNKLDEVSGIDAKKRGDIETLEKSWKEQTEKVRTEYEGKVTALRDVIKKSLVDGTADSLAAEISSVPTLLAKAARERLAVDFDTDVPTLRVLDAQGKVSALTVSDLKQEFVANKEYSSIIIASKASGSGTTAASQTTGNGGATFDKGKSFAELSVKEKVAYIKDKSQTEGN
jgi:hypothetical protein